MAKTTSTDFSFKMKDLDAIKKGYATTNKIKQHEEELEESLGGIVNDIKQARKDLKELDLTPEEIRAKKQEIKDNKEYRELLFKEHERLRKELWQRSAIGQTTKAIGDSIPANIKNEASNFGLAAAFGPLGIMAKQIGLTKLGGKALGWGWNQAKKAYFSHKGINLSNQKFNSSIINALNNTQENSDESLMDKSVKGGAGLWNKEEKRQEPIRRIDKNIEKILNKLDGRNNYKKNNKNKNLDDDDSSLSSALLGAGAGALGRKLLKKLLLPLAGIGAGLGLNHLYKNALPEGLKKNSEGMTEGTMIGAGKALKQLENLNYKNSYKNSLNKIAEKDMSLKLKNGKGLSKTGTNLLKSGAKVNTGIIKGVSKAAKGMKAVPILGTVAAVGADTYQGYEEYKEAAARGDTVGKQKAVAATGGRIAGGLAGAGLGAAKGAALGMALGPVGAVVGGLLGAAIGGLGGSWLGDKAGRGGVDAYHAIADKGEEENQQKEAYYPTQNEPVKQNNPFDEEREMMLRRIVNSLDELNNSLSVENQRFLDQEYLSDMKKLTPAPQANMNNNMWDLNINMNNPF